MLCYETILEYLKAFDDYASKKSYQNVAEIGKPKQKTKTEKKEDDAVIYGNQETIQELKKEAETNEDGRSEAPNGASNIPSKNEAPGLAESSPSSRRKSAPIKTKPMVLSKKPKPSGRARPKTTIDGRSAKPSGEERGTDVGAPPKKSIKKQEQLYENMTFDAEV